MLGKETGGALPRDVVAVLERHLAAVGDLVRVLRMGEERGVHAELRLDVAPLRPARTRVLIEAGEMREKGGRP
jgi:hypothetical protein